MVLQTAQLLGSVCVPHQPVSANYNSNKFQAGDSPRKGCLKSFMVTPQSQAETAVLPPNVLFIEPSFIQSKIVLPFYTK